ncbi:MAG: type III-A CRISPR-associated protein Csm2 [Chloroflexota bacterium]
MTISTLMTKDDSGAELVTFAERTASQLVKDNLTRSQIRGIFTEVRKIEAMWDAHPREAMRRLNMLKPKLDYQTSRTQAVRGLKDVLAQAIDEVNRANDETERNRRFRIFMDLFEAILAYHRAMGGRN